MKGPKRFLDEGGILNLERAPRGALAFFSQKNNVGKTFSVMTKDNLSIGTWHKRAHKGSWELRRRGGKSTQKDS